MHSTLYIVGFGVILSMLVALGAGVGIFYASLWRNLRNRGCPIMGLLSAIAGALYIGDTAHLLWNGSWIYALLGIPFYWWTEILGREVGHLITAAAQKQKETASEPSSSAPRNVAVTVSVALGMFFAAVFGLANFGQPLTIVLLRESLVPVLAAPVAVGIVLFCLSLVAGTMALIVAPFVIAINWLFKAMSRVDHLLEALCAACSWAGETLDAAGNRVADILPCGRFNRSSN